jgi:beta-lactamase class A
MLASMHRLLIDTPLTPESHARLIDWLMETVTGNEKLRAGIPAGWRVGDKTGMGGQGSTNDVAIVWPPGRKPLLVAAYITGTNAELPIRNGALAEVARRVAEWVAT